MRESVPSRWRAAIIVCRKCEKKLDGGFGPGGDQRLSKLLRHRAGKGKGRKAPIGIVASGCLKLCPKHAVTVVAGDRPHDWQVIAAGTPIEEVERRLGLVHAPEPG